MISEEFKDLIGRSINSISAKEKMYDLIDRSFKKEKVKHYEFENVIKDIDVTNCSWHQYFIIFIKKEVEDSLLELFEGRAISHLDREFIKEYAKEFMSCFNHVGCMNYRKLSKEMPDKIGKRKFESWNKLWQIDNIKKEVDSIAIKALEDFATHRYSEEVVECFVRAVSSKSFQRSIDHCQEIYKIGISSIENDLYF